MVLGVSPRMYRLVLLIEDPGVMSKGDLSGVALPFPFVTELDKTFAPVAEFVETLFDALLPEETEVDPLVDTALFPC